MEEQNIWEGKLCCHVLAFPLKLKEGKSGKKAAEKKERESWLKHREREE